MTELEVGVSSVVGDVEQEVEEVVEEQEVEALVVPAQVVVQVVVDFEEAKLQRSKVGDLGRTSGRH